MKRTQRTTALLLAVAMPLAGCGTTHLGGEYRTKSHDLASKADRRTVSKGSEWLFFWGLLDTGQVHVDSDIEQHLRPDEVLTEVEVKDRLSVGGFFLWLFTAGIVSHHAIVVSGKPAVLKDDKTATAPVTKERETIVVPAQPAPAGHEREGDAAKDYRDGYRDGAGSDAPPR